MSDTKLFSIDNNSVCEIDGRTAAVEKDLQQLVERHCETFLAVRFLASEHYTGKEHAGRIDTLGIDENGCPVIIEYKRHSNENVINQGLFYLDWLLDHQAEFELLVMKKLGAEAAQSIEWTAPRLLCIAADFTRYDEHAVKQINRNIELLRYRYYGDNLLLLELVNKVSSHGENGAKSGGKTRAEVKTVSDYLAQSPKPLQALYAQLKDALLALGEDVEEKTLKHYFAFRRLKNFACIEIHPQANKLVAYAKADLSALVLEEGFTRDVTNIGHLGTGNLEITIASDADIEKALPLIQSSYENN